MLANSRSQFLLDRPGRCLKLFVLTESTSCHELASLFGQAIFYTRKAPKTIGNTASYTRLFILMKHRATIHHRQRNRRKGGFSFVVVGRTPTDRTATYSKTSNAFSPLCSFELKVVFRYHFLGNFLAELNEICCGSLLISILKMYRRKFLQNIMIFLFNKI